MFSFLCVNRMKIKIFNDKFRIAQNLNLLPVYLIAPEKIYDPLFI